MIWTLPFGARDTVFCAGPDDAYDPTPFEVPVDEPSHTGLALNVLRARVDDDHDLEQTVWATCQDDEVIRSAVELALLMTAVSNNMTVSFTDSVPAAVRETVERVAAMAHHHRQVSWLLTVAQRIEQAAGRHHATCPTCRALLEDSPLLTRARFLRDLADGLALGAQKPFTLNGTPAKAGVDACWFLMQTTEHELGVSRQTQLASLGEALLDSVSEHAGNRAGDE